VDLPIVANENCPPYPPEEITDNMLCAGGLAEQDTCQGDSGGPLFVPSSREATMLVVGLSSFGGDSCGAEGEHGAYTRVSRYLPWINDIAGFIPAEEPGEQPAPPPPPPSETALCFEETPYCIDGRIRDFWLANGALPVFGLPITPQQEEIIEGQPRQVQWFERNRLELHPENARPYDVLIGRIGVEVLEQQGVNWFAFPQEDGERPGCRYFAETGQNVCGEILTAWMVDGIDLNNDGISGNGDDESLALFGLPIGGEITETLADGQEYTVQYFERARFERHPENEPPFNILLGRLGSKLRGE
jgi:hypothetical protein